MLLRSREQNGGVAIDLTPMIDMVFLLLIFFLVATTFHQTEREMQIALPFATSSVPISTMLQEIVINVDAVDWLRQIARRLPHGAAAIPGAIGAVDDAALLAQFNVNPQLTIGRLLRSLAEKLAPAD